MSKRNSEAFGRPPAKKRRLNRSDNGDERCDTKDNSKKIVKSTVKAVPIMREHSWNEFDLNPKLIKHLQSFMKFDKPTVIQSKSMPHLLQNRDILLQSETGSGKTMAYLIPIVNDISSELVSRSDGTKALVIAPTRELSIQINEVCQILTRRLPFIVCGHVMGGDNKKAEKQRLRKGTTILIGTPGKLVDHLENTQSFKFDLIKWLVLDEADRLLDLGFEETVSAAVDIISKVSRSPRCNILASATLSGGVRRLAKLSLNDPIHIGLDKNEIALDRSVNAATTDDVTNRNYFVPASLQHKFLCVKRNDKTLALIGLLRVLQNQQKHPLKAVIFMSTCAVVQYYFELFSNAHLFPNSRFGILNPQRSKQSSDRTANQRTKNSALAEAVLQAATTVTDTKSTDKDAKSTDKDNGYSRNNWFQLRGDMTQQTRTAAYFAFCNAQSGVLICTDVAARGLDIPAIDFIIQYDPPHKLQDYIHRSGRTARMGRMGNSIILLTPPEMEYLDILKENKIQFERLAVSQCWKALDTDLRKYESTLPTLSNQAANAIIPESAASIVTELFDDILYTDDSHKKSENRSSFQSSLGKQAIQRHFRNSVSASEDLKALANRGLQSFVKAYATYPNELKQVFYVKNLDFALVCHSFFVSRTDNHRLLKKGYSQPKPKKYSKGVKIVDDTKKKSKPVSKSIMQMSEFAAM